MCCSLFEISPHNPMCLDTWFPTGGIVWEALGSLGDEAFQKEVASFEVLWSCSISCLFFFFPLKQGQCGHLSQVHAVLHFQPRWTVFFLEVIQNKLSLPLVSCWACDHPNEK